jgi:serine/threonine protein phosphatase PrpC
MNVVSGTGIGKRAVNQDLIYHKKITKSKDLFLVVDGMGGYEDGGLAAKIVVDTFSKNITNKIDETVIQLTIDKANDEINQVRQLLGYKLGATIAGVLLDRSYAIFFWVGDVKIYQFRDKELIFESLPHTLMNEMLKNGSITNLSQASKYKHIVTRSIQGNDEIIQPDYTKFNLLDNDIVLICTDGVHDMLDTKSMEYYLRQTATLENFSNEIDKRCQNEAKDNYSWVVIKV